MAVALDWYIDRGDTTTLTFAFVDDLAADIADRTYTVRILSEPEPTDTTPVHELVGVIDDVAVTAHLESVDSRELETGLYWEFVETMVDGDRDTLFKGRVLFDSTRAVPSNQQYEIARNPTISIVSASPTGPRGLRGLPGDAAASYTHTQATTSASWVINHQLGFFPNVSAFDQSGDVVVGQVIHHSTDQAEIQFNSPRAGTARLS